MADKHPTPSNDAEADDDDLRFVSEAINQPHMVQSCITVAKIVPEFRTYLFQLYVRGVRQGLIKPGQTEG